MQKVRCKLFSYKEQRFPFANPRGHQPLTHQGELTNQLILLGLALRKNEHSEEVEEEMLRDVVYREREEDFDGLPACQDLNMKSSSIGSCFSWLFPTSRYYFWRLWDSLGAGPSWLKQPQAGVLWRLYIPGAFFRSHPLLPYSAIIQNSCPPCCPPPRCECP